MTMIKEKLPMSLTKLEEQVLNLIKERFKKHISFQLDGLFIDSCLRQIKFSEMEAYKTIYSLMRQRIIVPGSYLTREQILENENRSCMFQAIHNHPGIHVRELISYLKIHDSVVRAHLKVLSNFGFIRKKKYMNPKMVLLFTKDFPDTYDDFFIIWKNENDRRILGLLINNQLNVTELSSKLDVHHSTIQYHLKKLVGLNLIIQVEAERSTRYTFNSMKLEEFIAFLEMNESKIREFE